MQDQEDDFRRNRDQFTVDLRKENRENIFKKRRVHPQQSTQFRMEDETSPTVQNIIVDHHNKLLIEQIMNESFDASHLDDLCQGLTNENVAERHRAIIGLRVVVSEQQNFEIMQRVIDAGCVPVLIRFMRQSELPQIQLEATWILTNIACGRTSQCQSIIEKEGLEAFFQVIKEARLHIAQQAIWGLGNIAGDCPKFRDIIIAKGGLEAVLKAVEEATTVAMLQQGAWAISNLCRGTPRPKYDQVKSAIPVLAKLVMSGVLNDQSMGNCLWAISANSQNQKTRIQKVVQIKGFILHLFELCRKKTSIEILAPLLRVVGNVSNGNEIQSEELLRAGCLQVFTLLLEHPKKSIKREVCWIISNICVGTPSQLTQILTCPELLQKLSTLFQAGQVDVKKEICYIMSNLCHCGPPRQVLAIIKKYQFLENLIHVLKEEEEGKCLEGALQALFQVLQIGVKLGGDNEVYRELEQQIGFFEKLQELQKHPSNEVYQKLIKIFKTFFSGDSSFI